MITYCAKFIFDKPVTNNARDYLVEEFVKRRDVAVNILSEDFYKEVNAEFNALYPRKDGYSKEYAEFINKKCRPALDVANSTEIGLNLVRLISDPEECGDIMAECGLLNTKIRLVLEPRVEA